MATSKKVVSTEPTFVEALSAEAKLLANKQTAIVRGFKSITPEVIEAAQASDQLRTDQLTAHYLAKFS